MHHYHQCGPHLVKIEQMCKFFNSYEESLHLGECKLAEYVRNCVVFWKNLHSWQKFSDPKYRNSVLPIFGWDRIQRLYCQDPKYRNSVLPIFGWAELCCQVLAT